MNEIEANISIFFASFFSATILPGHSELALTALISLKKYSIILLIIFASLGNILGSLVNWYLGFELEKFKEKKWFPVTKLHMNNASSLFIKYGKWSLLLSWLPFIGDPLTLVAGVLRMPIFSFIVIVSIAKVFRYIFVSLITLNIL